MGEVENCIELIESMLGITAEEQSNAMLDASRNFLMDFINDAKLVADFEAIPEYWAWFRQLWINADYKLLCWLMEHPRMETAIKLRGHQDKVYREFHQHELRGRRPATPVMSAFNAKITTGVKAS